MGRGISDNKHNFRERGFLDIRYDLGDPTRGRQRIQHDSDSQLGSVYMVSVWHVDSSAFSALITLLNSTCQISGPTLPYDCREQSRHQCDLPPFLTVSLRSVFRAVPCIVAKHQLRKIL